MAEITQITNHHARALAKLASQYQDKPKLAALISVFTTQGQAVETMLWGILLAFRLATAVGEQLQILGRIVGQDIDNSADDDEYRLRIAARIRANLSAANTRDIYAVFRILLPEHTLHLSPSYPAGLHLEIVEAIDPDLVPLYQQFWYASIGDGIDGQVFWTGADPDETFTLSSDDTTQSSVDLGLGDDADPDDGGQLADVFAAG